MTRSARVAQSLLMGLALAAMGCRSTPEDSAKHNPILLLAVDGLEWNVLGPLVEAGQMPAFARLMEEGRFGLMETTRPTFSPIIWTSIATGKPAPEHGIRGFVKRRGNQGGTRRLYDSLDRQTKAFWNILSDYGRRSAVVGWWMTYPVESIEGVMVAQVNTLDQAKRDGGAAILKGGLQQGLTGQVFPDSRGSEVLEIHDRVVADLPVRVQAIFGDAPVPSSRLTERLWENTQWAFRADAAYVEIAERLAAEGFDLVACYLGGADVTGHRFWRFMDPGAFENPPTAEEVAAFGRVIPDYYRFVDQALHRLRSAMPPSTNVLVVTDHGMGPVNREADFGGEDLPEDINSAHHHGAKPGVVVAAGPGFEANGIYGTTWKKEQLPILASVFDVTPTVLTLLGVPVGEDMRGSVMPGVGVATSGTVPSHDSEDWLASRVRDREQQVEDDPERLKQLRALGYIN